MTLECTAMNFLRQDCLTQISTALRRPTRQTVLTVVKCWQGQTRRRLTSEEVERIREILKPRKLAYALRNRPSQHVMCHIQLLQTHQPTNCIRQWPHQFVEAQIQDRQVLEQSNFLRHARSEPIVHENDLVQIAHVANTGWHTPMEPVAGQHYHRNWRIAKVVGQFKGKPVVVDEYGIQRLVE